MSSSWHSYPSVYSLGHVALDKLFGDSFNEPVLIQEKVDGSQISFGSFKGELRIRSKKAIIYPNAPEKLFAPGVEYIKYLHKQNLLKDGVTYRCEYLSKPKHNVLAYNRIPKNYLALFDANINEEDYVTDIHLLIIAKELNIDVVPVMYYGCVSSYEFFQQFLECESFLGGQKVEGIVIKNYARFGPDKKVLMGKFVSEKFKETHAKIWSKSDSSEKNFIKQLGQEYQTEARWNKALLHLREEGLIKDELQDIGLLIKEVPLDIEKECKQEIMEKLYNHFSKQLKRSWVRGLPEWYKNKLVHQQFEK